MIKSKLIVMLMTACVIKSSLSQYVEFHKNHLHSENEQKNFIEYSFRYYIDEPIENGVTLDHWESRRSDGVVYGGYGYIDPNGNARNVYYKVEDKGFEAHVKVETPGGQFKFKHLHSSQPAVPFQHASPIASFV